MVFEAVCVVIVMAKVHFSLHKQTMLGRVLCCDWLCIIFIMLGCLFWFWEWKLFLSFVSLHIISFTFYFWFPCNYLQCCNGGKSLKGHCKIKCFMFSVYFWHACICCLYVLCHFALVSVACYYNILQLK